METPSDGGSSQADGHSDDLADRRVTYRPVDRTTPEQRREIGRKLAEKARAERTPIR